MQNKTKPESTQDSFNRVWQHFIVEKHPQCAREGTTQACRYRHEGNGCAIGCQLPDELIKDEMEGWGICPLMRSGDSHYDPKIVDWFSNVSPQFLPEIQSAHDVSQMPGEMKYKFSEVARRFGLTIPTQPAN